MKVMQTGVVNVQVDGYFFAVGMTFTLANLTAEDRKRIIVGFSDDAEEVTVLSPSLNRTLTMTILDLIILVEDGAYYLETIGKK